MEIKPIAHIENAFVSKFGIPRQSGLLKQMQSFVVLEPEYRMEQAIRGLEDYSHLWLIWGFSENEGKEPSLMVRPPRLGGNKRVGVFATRSPFRPNSLGLSCVELKEVKKDEKRGYYLVVTGADLLNGTPIYDIKPYLPYVEAHPDAKGGFAEEKKQFALVVECPDEIKKRFPEDDWNILKELLSQDPRPAYQEDPDRIYGMDFSKYQIHFKVKDEVLTVTDVAVISPGYR